MWEVFQDILPPYNLIYEECTSFKRGKLKGMYLEMIHWIFNMDTSVSLHGEISISMHSDRGVWCSSCQVEPIHDAQIFLMETLLLHSCHGNEEQVAWPIWLEQTLVPVLWSGGGGFPMETGTITILHIMELIFYSLSNEGSVLFFQP